MEICDSCLDGYVKFSEIEVGQDFSHSGAYYMRIQPCYSAAHTIEFNSVNIKTGMVYHFDDDNLVIPEHDIYKIRKN